MDLSEIVLFDNTARHPWELARLEVVKENLYDILQKIGQRNKPVQILDIGCGDTFVIAALATSFPQVQFLGLDINFTDHQLESLQKKYRDTNVEIHRSWESIQLEEGAVDVVLLLDVIEHIEDEIAFLASIGKNRLIRKDATFLVTVPAFQSLFAAHDVILGHYRRYTNASLKERLAEAGYQTEMTRYFFTLLLPPRLVQKLLEKVIPKDTEGGSDVANWKGGQGTSRMIKTVLVADYRVGSFFKSLGVNLPGLSNLALCRKLA